jgi:hypothetical protein
MIYEKDIREKIATRDAIKDMVTKLDIHRLEQKIDKSNKHLQAHEERLEALEEEQRSTHKD